MGKRNSTYRNLRPLPRQDPPRVSREPRNNVKPQQTIPKEVSPAPEPHYLKVPQLPADIVEGILKYLSLEDLFLTARVLDRMWKTLAMYRAGHLFAEWASTVQSPVAGDVKILYHGTSSKIHKNKRLDTTKEHSFTCKGTRSLSFQVTNHAVCRDGEDTKAVHLFFPVVESVQVNLSSHPHGWARLRDEVPMLCFHFIPIKKERPIPTDNWRFHTVNPQMKVDSIWMEVGGITERTKKVDLTCFLLQQFALKFNCEVKFERDYYDRNPWGGVPKYCHFNGYSATMEITPVASGGS
jgi:hypothetical protein